MSTLLFFRDDQPVFKRKIDQTEMIIGRGEEADIQLASPEISRRHCILENRQGRYRLRDKSRNGTKINDKNIKKRFLKPHDRIQIGTWVAQWLEEPAKRQEETILEDEIPSEEVLQLGNMVGHSKQTQEMFYLLKKASANDITVALLGESGTGKECAAQTLHSLSRRRKAPFVPLNCGAIPNNLIESILFGHERGSFTGASQRSIGVFEQANRGTLFLDEIGEMPLDLQTRLLRVLETRRVQRVGGTYEQEVNIRIIAATNKDLKKEMESGRFREDLFFRLFVFPITLPPLRERREDIPYLAAHFLRELSLVEEPFRFTPEALDKLKNHPWPGNIRELKNVIQRAVILTHKKVIDARQVEFVSLMGSARIGELPLEEQEKQSLLHALKKARGNLSRAARQLGVARSTVHSKIYKFKIEPKDWKGN